MGRKNMTCPICELYVSDCAGCDKWVADPKILQVLTDFEILLIGWRLGILGEGRLTETECAKRIGETVHYFKSRLSNVRVKLLEERKRNESKRKGNRLSRVW